jgi:hypothetical protein
MPSWGISLIPPKTGPIGLPSRNDAPRSEWPGVEPEDHWSQHILAGPAEVCSAGIRAVAHAGVELIPLKSIVDDAQQLERMAAGVVPAAARRP